MVDQMFVLVLLDLGRISGGGAVVTCNWARRTSKQNKASNQSAMAECTGVRRRLLKQFWSRYQLSKVGQFQGIFVNLIKISSNAHL